jgi:hypothetical protein
VRVAPKGTDVDEVMNRLAEIEYAIGDVRAAGKRVGDKRGDERDPAALVDLKAAADRLAATAQAVAALCNG